MDFAAQPEIYIDIAVDALRLTHSESDGHDGDSARGRESTTKENGHMSLPDGQPSHQGYPTRTEFSSAAGSMSSVDPKLLKLCVVWHWTVATPRRRSSFRFWSH